MSSMADPFLGTGLSGESIRLELVYCPSHGFASVWPGVAWRAALLASGAHTHAPTSAP
jgi:hypothetical protein